MRVDFFTFTALDAEKVTVNPLLVRCFQSRDGGKTTTIYFDGDHSVIVQASPIDVQEALTIDED